MNKPTSKAIGQTFSSKRYFSTSPSKRMLQKASWSINVSGRVCVNVGGVSTSRLRRIRKDAEVVFVIFKKVIFSVSKFSPKLDMIVELSSNRTKWFFY